MLLKSSMYSYTKKCVYFTHVAQVEGVLWKPFVQMNTGEFGDPPRLLLSLTTTHFLTLLCILHLISSVICNIP